MRRSLAGVALFVPLVVSACGSTVQGSQAGSGAQSGLSSTGGSTPTDAGSTAGAVVTGSGSTGAVTGGGTSTSGGSSTGAGSSSGGSSTGGDTGAGGTDGFGTGDSPGTPTSVLTARGVTAKTLTLGIALPTGTAAVANAFGVSSSASADPQAITTAVVNDINKHGGILGRKLAMYVHTYDAASAVANPQQAYATLCSDFRDDHKVFAVVFDLIDPTVRKCLADMGSPLIGMGGFAILSESAYKAYGGSYFYGPNFITIETEARLFMQSLVDRNFFEKWNIATGSTTGGTPSRLGLIHVDSPDQNALYAAYARELKKHGITFTDTVTYTADAGPALAATQNAVLKFRGDGITQVFGASAFFLRDAQNQQYFPRYAYLPGLGKIGADNVPHQQMRGAMTVGWRPTKDVGSENAPPDTAAQKHCKAVMSAAGFGTSNYEDLANMYTICDALYSVRAALTASKTPTVSGLRKGYEALGTSFKPSLSFTTTFGPSQHYGVSTVRDMDWGIGCQCLEYSSNKDRS